MKNKWEKNNNNNNDNKTVQDFQQIFFLKKLPEEFTHTLFKVKRNLVDSFPVELPLRSARWRLYDSQLVFPQRKTKKVHFRHKQGHVLSNYPCECWRLPLTCNVFSLFETVHLFHLNVYYKLYICVLRPHGGFSSCLQSPLNVQEDSGPASVPAHRFKSPG